MSRTLPEGFGITPQLAEEMFDYGLDVLTTGNHVWDKREIYDYFTSQPRLLRPANYVESLPGRGRGDGAGAQRRRLRRDQSARARLHAARPSALSARLTSCLQNCPEGVKVRFVDFHAEVTSEKVAMGWYLDGRVSAMVGTHTHVPTADTRILPGGTGVSDRRRHDRSL